MTRFVTTLGMASPPPLNGGYCKREVNRATAREWWNRGQAEVTLPMQELHGWLAAALKVTRMRKETKPRNVAMQPGDEALIVSPASIRHLMRGKVARLSIIKRNGG